MRERESNLKIVILGFIMKQKTKAIPEGFYSTFYVMYIQQLYSAIQIIYKLGKWWYIFSVSSLVFPIYMYFYFSLPALLKSFN